MINPVIMDYNGEPVSIENGEMLWWDADDGKHWNPQTLSFEPDEDDNDRNYYGCCGDDDRADQWWASLEHWDAVYPTT